MKKKPLHSLGQCKLLTIMILEAVWFYLTVNSGVYGASVNCTAAAQPSDCRLAISEEMRV